MNRLSPYPFTGGSPDLESGGFYLEDYALAERIAADPNLDFRADDAPQAIREAVHEAMDLCRLSVDVFVVASMAAQARQRNLRRPHWQKEREIRRDQWNLNPLSFNRSRNLKKERLELIREQVACLEMGLDYRKMAA